MKMRSLVAALMHAVRRTDRWMDMKLIGALRDYANAPNKRLHGTGNQLTRKLKY